jgi:hypothetical protein
MKKITLLCGICVCCLSGFAQSSANKETEQVASANAPTDLNISVKPHFFSPTLVGNATVYRGQDYTYTVDGAAPGSTFTWSSSDNNIAYLDIDGGYEGTFYIQTRAGGPISVTINVTVNSGGTLYYLSTPSQSVTCHNCPIPK